MFSRPTVAIWTMKHNIFFQLSKALNWEVQIILVFGLYHPLKFFLKCTHCLKCWHQLLWLFSVLLFVRSKHSSVYLWRSSRLVGHTFAFDCVDYIHHLQPPPPLGYYPSSNFALQQRVNTLLNFYCNVYDTAAANKQLCCANIARHKHFNITERTQLLIDRDDVKLHWGGRNPPNSDESRQRRRRRGRCPCPSQRFLIFGFENCIFLWFLEGKFEVFYMIESRKSETRKNGF